MSQPKFMSRKVYKIAELGKYKQEYIPGQSTLIRVTPDVAHRVRLLHGLGKSESELMNLFNLSFRQMKWILK